MLVATEHVHGPWRGPAGTARSAQAQPCPLSIPTEEGCTTPAGTGLRRARGDPLLRLKPRPRSAARGQRASRCGSPEQLGALSPQNGDEGLQRALALGFHGARSDAPAGGGDGPGLVHVALVHPARRGGL